MILWQSDKCYLSFYITYSFIYPLLNVMKFKITFNLTIFVQIVLLIQRLSLYLVCPECNVPYFLASNKATNVRFEMKHI
jgi:hypothetical protein